MQFIYTALTNSQNLPVKGKLSKWRHLETVIIQVLLVALLFFLIFQNGNLRKDVNQKLSHQFMEDIFDQKLIQLRKDIEEIKYFILQSQSKNTLETQQIKQLIRLLTKQIGLPFANNEEEQLSQVVKSSEGENNRYEEKEQEEEIEDINANETQQLDWNVSTFDEDEENESQYDNFEEENYENQEQVHFEESLPQPSKEICTYQEFLKGKLDCERDQTKNQPEKTYSQKVIRSQNKPKKPLKKEEKDVSNEFKTIFLVLGNLLLFGMVILCLFMMISFLKNPKYRAKPTETFEQILKMGSKPMNPKSLRMNQKQLLKF